MIDYSRKREAAERSRIDVHESDQLRYWCEKWRISEDRLKVAVEDSGPWVSRLARGARQIKRLIEPARDSWK